MINLKVKPNGQNGKMTLKRVIQIFPEVEEELEHALAKAEADEVIWLRESLVQEFGGEVFDKFLAGDKHYSLYEALSTPTKVKVDEKYLFGYSGKEDKRTIEKTLDDKLELKNLYESFSGGDTTISSAISQQAGVPLKKRQSEGEFRLIQLIVNSRYFADPFCRNVVDNFTRYVVGNGLKFIVQNPDVEDSLEEFVRQTNFVDLFMDYVRTTFKDGEGGLEIKSRIKKGDKAKVDWSVYKIFSEEIRGFEIHPENPGKKFSYLKQAVIIDANSYKFIDKWIADIEYFYQFNSRGTLIAFDGLKSQQKDIANGDVLAWFQHGDKRELRGRVPLEPTLRDLRLLEDFRISRAVLNYEKSKVLYLKKVKKQINRKLATTEIRKSAAPRGGVQLTLGPEEEYQMITASLNAADADTDGLLFLYAVATGMSMPIYIVGERADQQNYSALKNTDSPFHQMILEYAAQYTTFLKKIAKWVIHRNIESGILSETIKIKRVAREKRDEWIKSMEKVTKLLISKEKVTKEQVDTIQDEFAQAMEEVEIDTMEIPIDITIADAVKPNPLELAKTAFIERRLGMVSSRTLSEKRGYNWAQELIRMLEEKSLGIADAVIGSPGQKGSSTATTGLGSGGAVDDGSGTIQNPSK